MSDDRRLFRSLAGTLAVVLENVRFREQQQRQQEAARNNSAVCQPRRTQSAAGANQSALPVRHLDGPPNDSLATRARRSNHRRSGANLSPHVAQIGERVVRLDEEVEFVAAYLRVEQASSVSGSGLCVNPERWSDSCWPCASSLVENALRHGVSCLEGVAKFGSYAPSTRPRWPSSFNNGAGFPASRYVGASMGHALRNIAERLKGYYGEMGGLSWDRRV